MRAFVSAVALAAAAPAAAGTVDLFHQARLLGPDGAPLQGTHDLSLSLCDAAAGGSCVEAVALSDVSVQDGYATLTVPVDTAALLAGDLWVQLAVDGTPLLGRSALSHVPRAGVAEVARALVLAPGIQDTACAEDGLAVFDTDALALRVCYDGAWRFVGAVGVQDFGSGRQWSNGEVAASCDAYKHPAQAGYQYAGEIGSGLYLIDPDGAGAIPARGTYCDMAGSGEAWTLLLTADGNSTAFGNGTNEASSKWRTNEAIGTPGEALGAADFRSQAYGALATDEIRLCYQGLSRCFEFAHQQGRTLQSFFTGNATFVAYALNSNTHTNTGSDAVRTSYLSALGLTASTRTCYWLGIHDRNSYSAIGLLGDSNSGCAGSAGWHDDLAVGVGLNSCFDANTCDRGGTGHKAGQSRAIGGVDDSGVFGPWHVFGR